MEPTTWMLMEPGVTDRAVRISRIESVGCRLPERRLTTTDLMTSTRHRTHIDLEGLTGIHERRIATGEEDSFSLAVGAAYDCLARSSIRPDDLDVVINCSITRYHPGLTNRLEPPMSVAVAHAIGARDAQAFDIANACAGMLTGVLVLNNWIRLGVVDNGLVVSGEYISHLARNAARHIRSILGRELASLTLGDAGAAVILEPAPVGSPGISVVGFTTVADHSRLCLGQPARHEPGGRMFTKSRAIHRAAIADAPQLVKEVLDAAGLGIGDVDHVIPHQTSARAIRSGMAKLGEELGGAPRNPAVVTVDRYGNTASTTLFVALAEELRTGHIAAGDRVALLALASGLVIGVVLVTIDEQLAGRHGDHH